jgi:hypothetical protein
MKNNIYFVDLGFGVAKIKLHLPNWREDKRDIVLEIMQPGCSGICINGQATDDLLVALNKAKKRIEDFKRLQNEAENLVFKQDGNMICCHFKDFINLQESHAGFGKSNPEARDALLQEILK